MPEEDLVEVKFRLYDGSDIGPFRYSPGSTVAQLKERIVAEWPKDKKVSPKAANDIKIISGGRILENSKNVGQCRIPFGVEVKVDCKFKATAARAAEEITFSVSRTTNEYGWYKLEIPSVDGIECARGATVESVCRASLVGSSTSKCNVPGYTTTTDVVYFKSSQQNICIYGLSALNFRPSRKNKDLCAN